MCVSSLQYFLTLRLLCRRLKSFFSFFFVSNPMQKRVKHLGYDVSFNLPGDGEFFYALAAKALGVEAQA